MVLSGRRYKLSNDVTLVSGIILPSYPNKEQMVLAQVVNYYVDQKTIESEEGDKLINMIKSPDEENVELAKVILQTKYQVLK
jgi:hypothetical protein